MMPVESDFSEVNFSILEEMISQRRKNSFRHINRYRADHGRQKVIIRTLDIGADKQVEYFNLGKKKIRRLGTVQSGFV